MKTTILLLLLLPSIAFTQDTATVEQYCEAIIGPAGLFNNKLSLVIDDGSVARRAFGDYRLRDSQNKLILFNTRIDALNYMSRQGWALVHPLRKLPDELDSRFLFKKRVLR